MLKIIKHFSLALMAFIMSAPLLANSPFSVTIPNQQGGFSFGGNVLWLRPSAENSTYNVFIDTPRIPLELIKLFNNFKAVNPGYHWGFDVMLDYRIPCTGNDITLNWTHLGWTHDNSSATNNFHLYDDPVPVYLQLDSASELQFKYDAVDLDLGQRVNFGDYFNFRLFTGLRGVDLQQEKHSTYAFTFTSPVEPLGPGPQLSIISDQESKFRGIGPQMGIEGRYCLGYGFGLDANFEFSALVGRVDGSSTTICSDNTPDPDISKIIFTSDPGKKTRFVPAVDISLGADYTFNFNNCSRSSLIIQGGYKVIHYWNVSDLFATSMGGINGRNIGFDGPYLGLKVNI